MCFWSDYDWIAEVNEDDEGPAPERTRCDECGCVIHKGEWRRHVFLQEHEECQACEAWGDGESPCADGEHDYGETFDYDVCERCHLLLAAIEAVEIEEGCVGEETRPPLGTLYEAVSDAGGWDEYADKMRAIGRHAEAARVPCPDPSDVFESLADDYPGSIDDRHGSDPAEWFGWDHGGE